MINLNEIAFIDTDGFDYNDGECLVRFDTVMYCPDKKLITFAVTKQGRIAEVCLYYALYCAFYREFLVLSTTLKYTAE